MALVIFSLLTGVLLRFLSPSHPRGEHQTKEKPFTLYCLLPQRAHISILPPSLGLFYILSYFLNSSSSAAVQLYLYFIKFDVLTMSFEDASLSHIHRSQWGKY